MSTPPTLHSEYIFTSLPLLVELAELKNDAPFNILHLMSFKDLSIPTAVNTCNYYVASLANPNKGPCSQALH